MSDEIFINKKHLIKLIENPTDAVINKERYSIGTTLLDNDGESIETFRKTLSVNIAEVHNIPINEYFYRETGVETTISNAIVAGDTSITISNATGFTVGDELLISNTIREKTYPTITNIVGTVFTLDRPLNNNFAIGSKVELISTDLSAVGSLSSPISFKLIPEPEQIWYLVRFLIGIVHSGAADDSKFGDIAALTNGCILRAYDATNDRYGTFTNWKNNNDMKMDMYNIDYTDKSGGGKYGTNGRGSIKTGTGATPKINGNNGDFMELLIQDDLSALTSFRLKGQGHFEEI